MTLEDFIAAIEANVPALDAIDGGKWDEWTGSLTLSEDEWGVIKSALTELNAAIEKAKPQFDKWIDLDLAAREAAG